MPHNSCALVTGASRGIGFEIAASLLRSGWSVAACSRTQDATAEAARVELESLGPTLFGACDVTSESEVTDFFKAAQHELGPVSGVVSNAGITRDAPLVLGSESDWESVIATNLTGTRNVCKTAAFDMMKRKQGTIITMSSIAGIFGNNGQTAYAASKAGIIGFTKSLARETARFGVRVNAVAPGFIATDMTEALSEKGKEAALERIPMRRLGATSDVADMVSFLLSERATYITGQVLQVDGGMTL